MPSSPFDSEQPRALMGGPSSRSTTLSSDNPTTLPPPWIECVHPQGWLYFFHPELRIVSVEDIRDPHVYEIVMEKIPHYTCDDTEGELEIRLHGLSSKPVPFDYLAINHKHLLASHDLAEVQSKNVPLLGPVQIYRARKHYWNYMSRYPVHMPTPSNALQDAVDALVWYFTDNLVSGASSTVPFSKEECEELLRLLQHSNIYSGSSPSKTVFLAWILEEVYSFRVGENYAKFTEKQGREFRSKPQSLRGPQAPPRHRSLFMDKLMNTIIVVLCFGIPWTYMAHVKSARTYKGRLANVQKTWDAYIARLVQEYSNFLLIATVLLSATVSFLAVPNIGPGSLFACILATLFSLGSIIVGVFCIWRHQTNTTTTASFSYMHNAEHSIGLDGHATLLSLPPVLLVWAILTFTASIIAYTLEDVLPPNASSGSNPNSNSNLGGGLTTGTAWAVIGIFVLIAMSVSVVLYSFSTIWKWQPQTPGSLRFCVGRRGGQSKV